MKDKSKVDACPDFSIEDKFPDLSENHDEKFFQGDDHDDKFFRGDHHDGKFPDSDKSPADIIMKGID